ncbi:896_t:CDS:2 [Funneliformis caledonium]|uniref:896_t:CDS:1 n=1 Tax=Funneliformis caledonium TaxID=1117310 RepID=A0A9N8ZSS6_9GLOM|nr:896_t:CDS:2 [Funneliformis caledonium]
MPYRYSFIVLQDNIRNIVACGRDLTTELDKKFSNLSFSHY